MTLRITQYGESILHEKGKAVSDFSDELLDLANDMIEAMRGADGIGLAAQQIGKALRFCVIEVPDHPDYPMTCILDGKPLSPALLRPMPLANPKIQLLPCDEFYYEEGCLSLPEIKGDVARPERIRVEYQDLDGVPPQRGGHGGVRDGLVPLAREERRRAARDRRVDERN